MKLDNNSLWLQYSGGALFKNNAKRCGICRFFTVKLWCRATVCDSRKDQTILERSWFFFSLNVTELRMKNLALGFTDMSKSSYDLM